MERCCSKIAPIPIGIDLHTPRGGMSTSQLVALLEHIRASRAPVTHHPLRVFSDLSISLTSKERYRASAILRNCDHVDFLESRISQEAIWRRYAQYPFVLSAEGNGLDCHRTWELLYLGCIVITKSSPLDPLFEGLPVVIVRDWEEVHDKANLAEWLRRYAHLTDREHIWQRLDPSYYIGPIRAALRAAELNSVSGN